MPKKAKTSSKSAKNRLGSRRAVLILSKPFSRRLVIAFLAAFCVVGGYVLYLVSHADTSSSLSSTLLEFQSAYIGHCLSDWDNSSTPGSQVAIASCNGGPAQSWLRYSDDTIHNSGLCLATAGKSTDNGTNIVMATCDGRDTEKWALGNSSNGNLLVVKGTDKCITSPNSTTNDGAQQQLWGCHSPITKNQIWKNDHCDTANTCGYHNPLRGSSATKSRVDQGVDYGGTGPVHAVGAGKIVDIRPPATAGWDGGWWINEELWDGRARGRHVYVAEGCVPTNSLNVGDVVTSDTVICNMNGNSIETGWAQPPSNGDISMAYSCFDGSDSTRYGINYMHLVQAVNGLGGNVSNTVTCSLPDGWPTW